MATDDQSSSPPVRASAPAGRGLTVEQLANCLPVNAWQGPEGYSRRFFAEHLLSHPITGPRLRTEPTRAVAPAGGVTAEELASTIANVFAQKKPGNNLSATYDITVALWNDPRLGPLLRGEGAAAPKRVVLADMPLVPALTAHAPTGPMAEVYWGACYRTWAAASAEVERQQQQGGQADG